MTLNRRDLTRLLTASLSVLLLLATPAARAAEEGADEMIRRLSTDVLNNIKADKDVQKGDVSKITAFVDSKVMPNVNFTRMTASAVGRNWRQATPEQQKRLQDEFKNMLVRTYAGALSQVKDQTVEVKPLRAGAADTEVIVRTEVIGRGDAVQLDYRMEKTANGWKIYDFNVLGIWMVETYRTQFAQEISARGIDGLIATLAQRNKSGSGEKKR
ncbi:MAG: ABC transporter substrate-binding protein [Polaromonas sp.]|jgi:phospholipid transport system substrate-binding protein|nr:ABC transporter substrate-binding protein [Polaromonas sp.]